MENSDYLNRLKNSGRNDKCLCGSGKKYKKCHLIEDERLKHEDFAKKEKEREEAEKKKAELEEKNAEENGLPVKKRKRVNSKYIPPVSKARGAKGHNSGGLSRRVAKQSGSK